MVTGEEQKDGAFCVIGSGPAGVSAAAALVQLGHSVTMLDAGNSLDAAKRDVIERLGQLPPDAWNADDVSQLKEGTTVSADGITLKRSYGSTFAFDGIPRSFQLDAHNTDILPSFARGGLSSVWGAGALPLDKNDVTDWPFSVSDLEPHYRSVLSFLPYAACRDDLEENFPLHSDVLGDLPPSRQADAFLRDAARARSRLRGEGVTVGKSRLAVRAQPCRRCGMCLYGCPYRLIYNSEQTLEQLRLSPNFQYLPDFVVEELRESKDEVAVLGRDRRTGEARVFCAGRVLLGAGVIPSGAILLRSLGEYGTPLRVQDSHYFLLPLLRFSGAPDIENENLHTMAQAFIVIQDPVVSESLVHLSVYTYNDLTLPSLRAAGGPLGKTGGALWRALAARLLVCGGYLHSRHSPGFTMSIARSASGGVVVRLDGDGATEHSRAMVRRVGHKILKQAMSLRAIALTPLIRYSLPGRGFHAGGTFPISKTRQPHTSDLQGRPYGFERVHLVDASSLPSIPATTITLTVMANAHRIATLAGGAV